MYREEKKDGEGRVKREGREEENERRSRGVEEKRRLGAKNDDKE